MKIKYILLRLLLKLVRETHPIRAYNTLGPGKISRLNSKTVHSKGRPTLDTSDGSGKNSSLIHLVQGILTVDYPALLCHA